MSAFEKIKERFKQFKPTSWVVDHKTVTYVATIVITLWGLRIFTTLPKESYPDIVLPQIYVSTLYPGTSPKDMENLVTRPIEKQIKGITGAKIRNIKSTSIQDYSSILVEFETNVKVEDAKQKVKRDISAGNIKIGETQPTIQVKGQFKTAYDMRDLVVKSIYGNPVYLRDISQIIDTAKEKESYSRLGNKNVVTLQIIKRAGEN